MSKRKGEEEEKAGPSRKIEKIEEREHEAHELYLPSEAQFSLAEPSISGCFLFSTGSISSPLMVNIMLVLCHKWNIVIY